MIDHFLIKYSISSSCDDTSDNESSCDHGALSYLLSNYGGVVFNHGIYRIHSFDMAERITAVVEKTFPQFSGKIFCFGCDWLGNQFAIDKEDDERIILFDLGAGEGLEIPGDLLNFHNNVLCEDAEAALVESFFMRWMNMESNTMSLSYDKCMGYQIPLFLGGEDEVSNLEMCDLEVYVDIAGQLIAGTRHLKAGDKVDRVTIGWEGKP